jgi:hypothetical protein
MSGDIGKSWKIETMPPWLMKPCCMLTPSSVASSPDWRPPLMRASNALAPPPVLTPGIRIAKVAAARGPLFMMSGSCCSVSGVMPCSCVAVWLSTDAPAVTSMVSVSAPTGSSISTRTVVPIGTSTFALVTARNPSSVASTE